MRTTVEIPEELLEEARQISRSKTNRQAIISGLEELIRKSRREELRQLAGRIDLKVNLRRSRKRQQR